MRIILAFVLYMMIGGLLTAMFSNHYNEKCGHHIEVETAFYLTVAWPGIITMALALDTNDNTKSCS